jgi:hypothetical protein
MTKLLEDEIKKERGYARHSCRYFLTILDNVLTVGKLARGEEYTGRPHSPKRPSRRSRREYEKSYRGGLP